MGKKREKKREQKRKSCLLRIGKAVRSVVGIPSLTK